MKKKAAPSSSRKSDDQKSYKKDAGRKYGKDSGKPGDKPTGGYRKRAADGEKAGPFKGEATGGGERKSRTFDKPSWKSEEKGGDKKPGRPYSGKPDSNFNKKPYSGRQASGEGDERAKRPYSKERPERFFDKEGPKRPSQDRPGRETGPGSFQRDKKPFAPRPRAAEGEDRPKRAYGKERAERAFDKEKPKRISDRPAREGGEKSFGNDKPRGDKKPFAPRPRPSEGDDRSKKPYSKEKTSRPYDKERPKRTGAGRPPRADSVEKPPRKPKEEKPIEAPMTLNKYIAHSGECSRRDGAELVKQGKVRVNGELVLDPGYRVSPGDEISLGGKKLTPQKNLVYILLNKPKDFITTTDDPEGRKTVMDLVESAEVGRVYPIGRLDRNTTGLLLLTNDGTLAQKLSHPSHNVRKVYQVTLDKNLTRADYDKIVKGLELEDGLVNVDALAYLENRDELGIEIHSGKNRIVRRIFESLGYVVEKLDRVSYAGLTKKNLPRGKWRFLDEKETILLKHFKN